MRISRDKNKVVVIPDHYIFTADDMCHRNVQILRDFVKEQGLPFYYDPEFISMNPGMPSHCTTQWIRISVQAMNQKWRRRFALRRRIEPKIRTSAERTIVVNKPSKFISPYFALQSS